MTRVSRIMRGIATAGVISTGFLINPSNAVSPSLLKNLNLPHGLWMNLIGVPLTCGLVVYGALTLTDRLISS